MKYCPFCAEEIKDEAVKCKHCGEFFHKNTKKEIMDKIEENEKIEENKIPSDVLDNCNLWKVNKVKNPIQYGGWSHAMRMWALLPIIGLLISIFHLSDNNPVKNAQAKNE